MKLFLSKKILLTFSAIMAISFFANTVFAVWSGTFYEPGDTLNPECLPSDPDCDVRSPLTILNIDDTAYGASWDTDTTHAPSKNAVYDALNALPAGHDAVTLGTANGLFLSTQQLSLALASASTTGALSDTDWNTFNNKVSSQWTTNGSDIHFNTGNVGMGIALPTAKLDILDTTLAGSGSLAGSALNMAQTWNTTGAPTGLKFTITDTASSASSLAMQILGGATGTTNLFKVDKAGTLTSPILSASSYVQSTNLYVNNIQTLTSANTLNIYGRSTVDSNGDFVALGSRTLTNTTGASNIVKITPTYNQVASTAANTDLLINRTETAVGSGEQLLVDAQVGGVSKFKVDNLGNINVGTGIASSNGNFSLSTNGGHVYNTWAMRGQDTTTNPAAQIKFNTSGSQTSGNVRLLEIIPTYNQVASTAANTDLLINRTETAVGSGAQYLIDAQVGGVSKFSVNNTGGGYFAGNVGIGTASPSYPLDVVTGTSFTDGGIRTKYALRFGSNGTSAAPVLFSFAGSTFSLPDPTGKGLGLYSYTTTAGDIGIALTGNSITATSGINVNTIISRAFAPTSGTGLYANLSLTGQINQTGGANGITRGIHINPTLTSAADWRSLEIENNSGFGIYQSGASAKNYFAGRVGIGTTIPAGQLSIVKTTGSSGTLTSSSDFMELYLDDDTEVAEEGPAIIFSSNYFSGAGKTIRAGIRGITEASGNNASGALAFYTNGGGGNSASEKMRITSTGNIGIGRTTPTAKLDILDTTLAGSGSLAGSALNIAQTWNTTGNPVGVKIVITDTASGSTSKPFQVFGGAAGTTSLFSVDKTGQVAINSALTAGNISGSSLRTGTGRFSPGAADGTVRLLDVATNATFSKLVFGLETSLFPALSVTSAATPTLTVQGGDGLGDSNLVVTGNLGIGITPTAKLHVSGTMTVTGNATFSNSILAPRILSSSSASSVRLNDLRTYSTAVNSVEDSPTYTNTSGSIGALVISPTYNQASGTAANTDLLINRTETAIGSGAQYLIDAQVGGVSKFSISNAGAITSSNLISCGGIQTNGSGTMSCTSDERLKDISGDFNTGLSAIMKINPQTYSWKEDSGLYDGGINYSGFIAQNIEEAIPEAVNINPSKYLQINTTTILATTINAVKELNLKIESLAVTVDEENKKGFSERFFENLFTKITSWLADAGNGIKNIFVEKVETKEICVSDETGAKTCITKSQLDALILNAGSTPTLPPPTVGGGAEGEGGNQENGENGESLTCTAPLILNDAGDDCVDPMEPTPEPEEAPQPEVTPLQEEPLVNLEPETTTEPAPENPATASETAPEPASTTPEENNTESPEPALETDSGSVETSEI